MAIEILHHGTPPSERRYLITCRPCKTVFRFLRTDAEFTSDQRDGDFLSISCPVCGVRCTTQVKDWERSTVDPY